MINNFKFNFFLILVLFLANNCVEHQIKIIVDPNGSFKYSHYIEGDKSDILDLDYPIPKSNEWKIKNNFNHETDKYFYSFEKYFAEDHTIANSFYNEDSLSKDILLNHILKIDYKNRIINEYYNFNFTFKGRNANEKYSILYSFLQNQENPPPNWMHNGLTYIFKQAILESGFEFNIENIVILAIENWLNTIKLNYDNDLIQKNFKIIKNEGIQIVHSQLIDNSIEKFKSLLMKYEKETLITIDLTDDLFEFYVKMPGLLQETNADSIFSDTLLWRFSGLDFADKDYNLIAKSSIYHKSRFQWIIISIMLLVSFTILYLIASKVPDPIKPSK